MIIYLMVRPTRKNMMLIGCQHYGREHLTPTLCSNCMRIMPISTLCYFQHHIASNMISEY